MLTFELALMYLPRHVCVLHLKASGVVPVACQRTLQSITVSAGGVQHFLSINTVLSHVNTGVLYPGLIMHCGCVFKSPPGPQGLPQQN